MSAGPGRGSGASGEAGDRWFGGARVDALFALASAPRTALLLDRASAWREPLEAAGVECLSGRGAATPADLVVAESRLEADAASAAGRGVILEGRRRGRALAAAGFDVAHYFPLPDPAKAEVLLPLGRYRQVRHGLDRSPPSVAWKRGRNRVVARLLGWGVAPPGRIVTTVASRPAGPPFLIAAAAPLGIPRDVDWLLSPGQGDALARGVLHLFPPGSTEPAWALKFSRVVGHSAPFDRDERGLGMIAGVGGAAAAHAPSLVGRLVEHGRHASVETAAGGRSLLSLLASPAPRPTKLEVTERVAAWILELGRASALPEDDLAPERRRLRDEVAGAWRNDGADPDLVDRVGGVPAVLQHNDLGSWNVVVERDRGRGAFTVLDWEAARRAGLPLWDLWYFLQDALAEADGVAGAGPGAVAAREEHAVRLFRGELESSPVLFEWTRRGVADLGLPAERVGAIATLCFLHHGLSQAAREATLADPDLALDTAAPRIARRWLVDPALGPGWSAWR